MKNFKLLDFLPALMLLCICLILLIFAYTAESSKHFDENYLVENFQLVILLASIAVCIKGYKNKGIPRDIGRIFLIVAFIVFCMAGREINWGRILYPHLHDPYLQILRYIIIIISALIVLYFIKIKLYKVVLNLLKNSTIYISDIFLILFFAGGSIAFDKSSSVNAVKYEEISETMLYCTILSLAVKYCLNKKNRLNV